MLHLKKILCPTDFSGPSYEALKRASELALHFSAELIVVHVINPIHVVQTPGDPAYFQSYERDMEASVARKLNTAVRAMVSAEVKLHSLVVRGNPAEEIAGTAAKKDADVIVIATHGMTGWRHYIHGSVAEKVVRCAPCAVLTVKPPNGKREAIHALAY